MPSITHVTRSSSKRDASPEKPQSGCDVTPKLLIEDDLDIPLPDSTGSQETVLCMYP